MKTIKYSLCVFILFWVGLSGCYEDKGSYDYEDWTGILSVSGVKIPGSSYGSVTISEGDTLKINPEIQFKEGVNPDDFGYYWVMGGDTIGTGRTLVWEITPTNVAVNSNDKTIYFWLAISNRKTGESWKYYATDRSGDNSYMVKVKIVPTAMPLIGAIVYEKPDGSLEWGSVKGSNPATPANFKTILTDMYERYNPGKKITGLCIGATLTKDQLCVYTSSAPDYGVMVQTSSSGTYPFGNFMGSIRNNTFMSDPANQVVQKNYCYNDIQEILVGEELFLSSATSSYPYQMIDPNGKGNISGVAQVARALPYTRHLSVNVHRMTNGDIWFYTWHEQLGSYRRVALEDGAGNVLKLDKIVGLFREPTFVMSDAQTLKFFLVGKTGSNYRLLVYTVRLYSNGNDVVTYVKEKDVSSWAGGVNDQVMWFTTVTPVGWNYAYLAKGHDLWRFGYEALEEPQVVKNFEHDIVCVQAGLDNTAIRDASQDYYTAVFTYDPDSHTSRMYAVDIRTEEVKVLSPEMTVIPGKVLEYLVPVSN